MGKNTAQEVLLAVSTKTDGSWDATYDMIRTKVMMTEDELASARDELTRLARLDIKTLALSSTDYPRTFVNATRPPFVVFCRGRLDLLYEKSGLGLVVPLGTSSYSRHLFSCLVDCFKGLDEVIKTSIVYDASLKEDVLEASKSSRLVLFFLKGLDTLSDEEKRVADFVVSQGGLVVSLVLPNKAKTTKDNVLSTYNLVNAITVSTYFAEFYYKRRKIRAIDEDLLNLSLNSGNEVLVAPRPAIFKKEAGFIGDDSNELIRNGATIVYDLKSLNESAVMKN